MTVQEKRKLAETLMDMADYLDGIGHGNRKVRIGVTVHGSELGDSEIWHGIELANHKYPDIECIPIEAETRQIEGSASCEKEIHLKMDGLFKNHRIDAAVTMHYPFPIGIATVGRVPVPANGREIFIATTTGSASSKRVESLVLNAICGISAAKACGVSDPTVGFLNIDGARQAEKILSTIMQNGYPVRFGTSSRSEGSQILRGNDILNGASDVIVADSLTGNIIMKMMSAFHTGGNYESVGYGYGPGIGSNAEQIVGIVSRASGAPVIAGAIRYAADAYRGKVLDIYSHEKKLADRAGLMKEIDKMKSSAEADSDRKMIQPPPEKVVTEEIAGIDILELDEAVQQLWGEGIFGKTGMGCTGPVILVAEEDKNQALSILQKARYI